MIPIQELIKHSHSLFGNSTKLALILNVSFNNSQEKLFVITTAITLNHFVQSFMVPVQKLCLDPFQVNLKKNKVLITICKTANNTKESQL